MKYTEGSQYMEKPLLKSRHTPGVLSLPTICCALLVPTLCFHLLAVEQPHQGPSLCTSGEWQNTAVRKTRSLTSHTHSRCDLFSLVVKRRTKRSTERLHAAFTDAMRLEWLDVSTQANKSGKKNNLFIFSFEHEVVVIRSWVKFHLYLLDSFSGCPAYWSERW